jgi:hypothetical protein
MAVWLRCICGRRFARERRSQDRNRRSACCALPPRTGRIGRPLPQELCRQVFRAALPGDAQDRVIKRLEDNSLPLEKTSVRGFGERLLKDTQQGFLADPIYGGNRDMCAWKIGFPARYDYRERIGRHNQRRVVLRDQVRPDAFVAFDGRAADLRHAGKLIPTGQGRDRPRLPARTAPSDICNTTMGHIQSHILFHGCPPVACFAEARLPDFVSCGVQPPAIRQCTQNWLFRIFGADDGFTLRANPGKMTHHWVIYLGCYVRTRSAELTVAISRLKSLGSS